ncbi:L,D-transpeptidase [Kineococcus terrestris]|uniref:L,D-transpeptidase n=1 Tax=Kineococcus terrestris TaxID=2044856 RepID=UPI0034DAC35A
MSSGRRPSTPARRGARAWVPAALVLALAAPLGACQADSGSGGAAAPAATASPAPARIDVLPADAALDVRLDAPVTVRVTDGQLDEVVVTAQDGTPLEGAVAGDGLTWTSTAPLLAGARYEVRATAHGSGGAPAERTSSFTALDPAVTAFPAVAPLSGSTVGVGMPVIVTFDEAVADDRRALVEERLRVTTSPAPVEGSWRWVSATQVQYRPAEFWPAQTDVHLDVDLGSTEVAPGVWGVTRDIDFHVGAAVVSQVDVQAHTLTVTRDGEVLRTIPVTTGQDGHGGKYVTRSGTKVVMSLEESRQMDAETTGVSRDDPEYYDVAVRYAMRLTNSGEFLHAAPWSAASHGRANVSHGCTGMGLEDARWLFEQSHVGDVVVFTGTDRAVEPGNGFDAWGYSWEQWRAGSALQG